jgi:hypothetical protein
LAIESSSDDSDEHPAMSKSNENSRGVYVLFDRLILFT